MTDLPLFPLQVVLFPNMLLPLHIFEERYKEMLRLCLAGDRTFGVALIKEGREVGGPATPHSIGTVAYVETIEPLPEGRMNLVARGLQRFRLLELVRREPYLMGRVELLVEEPSSPTPELLAQVVERYRAYLEGLRGLGYEAPQEVAEEPEPLSFQIAATLLVQVPERQRLLETPGTAERLERELGLLRREIELVRLLGSAPKADRSEGPFSRN